MSISLDNGSISQSNSYSIGLWGTRSAICVPHTERREWEAAGRARHRLVDGLSAPSRNAAAFSSPSRAFAGRVSFHTAAAKGFYAPVVLSSISNAAATAFAPARLTLELDTALSARFGFRVFAPESCQPEPIQNRIMPKPVR